MGVLADDGGLYGMMFERQGEGFLPDGESTCNTPKQRIARRYYCGHGRASKRLMLASTAAR